MKADEGPEQKRKTYREDVHFNRQIKEERNFRPIGMAYADTRRHKRI